jgi:CheY-like chemotaxis protein
VAKILVADDNSNVQKTVALALVDLGVEVVAVNNGDAAVRKLADVMPDLVLADIFMPVRNGYEVCEYIKKDSRFSHVPVVLLVGAFDPLDEREAQRVGADGILKKPFVPPDPLMSMVKTLLDRTMGDRLVTVAISKTAVSAQGKAGGGVATVEKPPVAAPVAATAPIEEPPVEEFLPPVDRVSFGEGERPIAFGQLLDTPAKESAAAPKGAVEPVDDEQVLTGTRDASLGDPIFWRTEEPEAEAPEEESDKAEEEEISGGAPMRSWKLGDESLTAPSSNSTESDSDFLQPVEPFELVRDEKDDEAGKTPTVAAPTSLIAQDAASQASLNVEPGKPEDLAANPIEWMATAPPPPAEEIPVAAADWTAPPSESAEDIEAVEAEDLKLEEEEPVAPQVHDSVAAPISIPSAVVPPAPPVVSPQPPAAPAETKIAAQTSDPHKTQPSLKPMTQSVEDTARSILKQDWADLAASLQQQPKPVEPIAERLKPGPILGASVYVAPAEAASVPAIQPPAHVTSGPTTPAPVASAPTIPGPVSPAPTISIPVSSAPTLPAPIAPIPAATVESSQSAPTNLSVPGAPDPALVEAVVQRVLDKMRPQVVDIITKEFLRPVVQALVHREIQKR